MGTTRRVYRGRRLAERVNGMRNRIRTKLLLCAGMLLAALAAQASFVDASILIDRAANNRTLTVRYDGALAALVELRVNGVSVASRKVSDATDSGETEFQLDTAALVSGRNTIEIRLYDAQGKLLGKESSEVAIDRSGTGPVFIASPSSEQTTQGFVEIRVGFRQQLRNVYVSFFVNDEFKVLKNFPPYTYIWDTTTVPNGWHEVQAWVVDDLNATFKTEKIRLYVNNPGGPTRRQAADPVTPTRQQAASTEPAASNKVSAPAVVVIPRAANNRAANTLPGVASGPKPIDPATARQANTRTARPGTITIIGEPETKPADNTGQIAIETVKATGNEQTDSKPADKSPDLVTLANPAKLAPVLLTFGTRLPDMEQFDILWEGQKVDFDVQPRVTDGVPLSPFRHLFEASGGKVTWDNLAKTVTGESDSYRVWFRIGDPTANVDGNSVTMEVAPFLERGRSIVPLSFVSEALKLDVQFDPNTGHVLILSQRKR